MVEQGIQTTSETASKMEDLLTMIGNVQNDIQSLLDLIKNQKFTNEDIVHNFKRSTSIFDETNTILNEHIEEADVVTVKLLEAVEKVKNFEIDK